MSHVIYDTRGRMAHRVGTACQVPDAVDFDLDALNPATVEVCVCLVGAVPPWELMPWVR